MGTGLRKVINSLVSAVKAIGKKNSVLDNLGIKKEEMVDANGNLKSMTDIMGVLQKHTESMDKTQKNAVFNSLFGTTGQQAGMILAENSQRLGELTQRTQEAADKGKYVQTLSEKNSETAQANNQKFKKAWEDLEIKFGAELLPYMTEATRKLGDLFGQKDFQKDVKIMAEGVGFAAKLFLKFTTAVIENRRAVLKAGAAIAGLLVVDKVINFTLKLKELATVFGGFGSKVAKEQAEVKALALEYQSLAEAKTLASNSYTGVGSSAAGAEKKMSKPVQSAKIAEGIEEGIATSGAVEKGVTKSVVAAGNSSMLSSFMCKFGTKIMGLAEVAISLHSIVDDVAEAIKTGSESSKVKAAANVAGTAIGAGVGFAAAGPMGAALGSSIGNMLGSTSIAQKIVKGLNNAVKKAAKEQQKQFAETGYVTMYDGTTVKVGKVKVEKSSLTKAQKSVSDDIRKSMDKADLSVIKMSVQSDDKSLNKAKATLEGFYASVARTAERQSQKRADAEKRAVEQMYKQHQISKKQYEEYIKGIDDADKKRQSSQKKTYDSLIKATNKYNEDLKTATANGGVARTGLALVGEAGPELVYTPWSKSARIVGRHGAEVAPLNQGEQVLNARDTARVMAGSYSGTLPGYATGTFSLSGFIGSIKDKALDIADSVLDVLKKPVKWIARGFSHWPSVQAFSFTHTTLMDQTRNMAKKSLINPVTQAFKKLLKSYDDSGTNPSGSGVKRWEPYVKKALAKLGLSTSSAMVSKVLRQINTESGGNPHAKQPGADPDGDGSGPALGLMQTKRSTFNAYALAGHKDIWNGYDNMLAGLNYARTRYGASLSALGKGHGYANGGLVSTHGVYEMAEQNLPEMVIPLDLSKRSRAYQLMQKSLDYFARTDNHQGVSKSDVESEKSNNRLEQTLSAMLTMLSKIFGASEEQIEVLRILSSGNADRQLADIGQKLDAIANKQLRVDGSSFARSYEQYGSVERNRRDTMLGRGMSIDTRI